MQWRRAALLRGEQVSRLSESVADVMALLREAPLGRESVAEELLERTSARRRLDLSDLSPSEQAAFLARRAQDLRPSEAALEERLREAARRGRPFVAKFGIDPTGAEVHLGHAVPMLVLSRLQRMGHEVVFIVGDFTAKIGDPSGLSEERPALTDEEIAGNLATYQAQVEPFFDFQRAKLRRNSEWLNDVRLARVIEVTSRVPASMPLQRDDFRRRIEGGRGLSLAELLYSVLMALDSVELACDVEVGGIDQFLNLQMCRHVMAVCGLPEELVVVTPLIEGTDGTGAKMSKSKANYVPLVAPPEEIFGRLMAIPDRLMFPYFQALTEWADEELALLEDRLATGSAHPAELKRLLAGDVTAALCGTSAAMAARRAFDAQFSRSRFSLLEHLPVVDDVELTLAAALRRLSFVSSNSEASRLATQRGLRLVVEEVGDRQREVVLGPEAVHVRLAELVGELHAEEGGAVFLRVGRRLARIAPNEPGGMVAG